MFTSPSLRTQGSCCLPPETAAAQRDAALRQYVEAEVSRAMLKPDAKEKLLALTREVRAGKRGRKERGA